MIGVVILCAVAVVMLVLGAFWMSRPRRDCDPLFTVQAELYPGIPSIRLREHSVKITREDINNARYVDIFSVPPGVLDRPAFQRLVRLLMPPEMRQMYYDTFAKEGSRHSDVTQIIRGEDRQHRVRKVYFTLRGGDMRAVECSSLTTERCTTKRYRKEARLNRGVVLSYHPRAMDVEEILRLREMQWSKMSQTGRGADYIHMYTEQGTTLGECEDALIDWVRSIHPQHLPGSIRNAFAPHRDKVVYIVGVGRAGNGVGITFYLRSADDCT